jgi:hypothetical protein
VVAKFTKRYEESISKEVYADMYVLDEIKPVSNIFITMQNIHSFC